MRRPREHPGPPPRIVSIAADQAASRSPSPWVMLAMVIPAAPVPKLTVNRAGSPRSVERTAVTYQVTCADPAGSVSSMSERTPLAPMNANAPVPMRRWTS